MDDVTFKTSKLLPLYLGLGGLLLAASALIISGAALWSDFRAWNEICGSSVRLYHRSFAAIMAEPGFSGWVPLLAECYVCLIIPSMLMRSVKARWVSLFLMAMLLVVSGLTTLGVSTKSYQGECYKMGGENAPGDIGVVFVFWMFLVSAINAAVLVTDWLVWAVVKARTKVKAVMGL